MQIPGPWQIHTGGRQVFCNALVRGGPQRAGAEFPCRRSLVWVGRRKLVRLRVVGNADHRMPASIEGNTIRCRCGTVYELEELQDRRTEDRPGRAPLNDQAAS